MKAAVAFLTITTTLVSITGAAESPTLPTAREIRQAVIHDIVFQNIAEGLFSGAQITAFEKGILTFEYHAGFTKFDGGDPVTRYTLFDLASLTKPLGTLLMCGRLFAQHRISPDDLATEILPEIVKPIRIGDLIAHTSGLPGYDGWFIKYRGLTTIAERKAAIVRYAAEFPKTLSPKYSDLNYLLLGFIIEQVAGKPLDQFYRETLISIRYTGLPLLYLTNDIDPSAVIATSVSSVDNVVNHGRVEDENCQFIGGLCGHSGLFGSAEAVGQLLSHLLKIPWYRSFIEEGIGFDKPEPPDSNYGTTATPTMRGHLGFTGTAFLVDLQRNRVIVVFANRTHPTPNKPKMKERLRAFRQQVFDELLK